LLEKDIGVSALISRRPTRKVDRTNGIEMEHYAKEPIEVSVDYMKFFYHPTIGGGP
jgi:hypothetical protein